MYSSGSRSHLHEYSTSTILTRIYELLIFSAGRGSCFRHPVRVSKHNNNVTYSYSTYSKDRMKLRRKQLCTVLPAILWSYLFARHSRYFTIFTKFLMTTELQVFVFVRVTVNAPLVPASLSTNNSYSYQCECGLRPGFPKDYIATRNPAGNRTLRTQNISETSCSEPSVRW